jgi:hypothetical protein
MPNTASTLPFARRILASILCGVAAVAMRSWGGHLPFALWIPVGLLAASAVLVHHRRLASQLVARAVLWSNLILGTVIAVVVDTPERPVALLLAGATGGALLLIGRAGLTDDDGSFVPVAFRATLLGLMVMALADAQSLSLFGALELENFHPARPVALEYFALAAGLIVAIVGIYRLRVWGLVLGAFTWVALATAALAGWLELPTGLAAAFVATSAVQLVLAAPLFARMWTAARRTA